MAKVITFFTSIILIYIIYNYPVNKGYPLLGFLLCLIVLSFSASKIYSDYKKMGDENYENVEKNTDKILKNNGIFEYKNDGFSIKQGNTLDFVKWIDVESISHFELKMLKNVSQNGIEIVTNKKIYKIHNNDEQTIGLEKFENEVNKNLSIEKLYDSEVLSDGSSKTLLYQKTLN